MHAGRTIRWNADQAGGSGAEPPGDSAPAEAPALSIVALDDDADFREYIVGMLEPHGHDACAVATPAELYDVCEARLPEVVLLDINMGRDRGEHVLAELRSRWPKLCVVVITGYPSMDSMRETFKREVFDYIAKPFTEAELLGVLGQAAERFGLGKRPQDRLRTELGRQVRLARTARGWTLKELSEASQVSVSQLSSIERGAHLPSLESLLLVSQALGVAPSDWLRSSGF